MSKLLAAALFLSVVVSNASASAVSHVGSFRFPMTLQGHTVNIPYDANQSITVAHTSVKRCVVTIHGSARNSQYDNATMVLDATTAGVNDATTLTVAPQFLTEEDISAFSLPSDMLFWADEGWKQGDQSLSTSSHSRPVNISSFAVLDSVLVRIASLCPNLKSIVICGHSAGGQFTDRFAAGSQVPPMLAQQFRIPITYVVANPSSYLYFDRERPIDGTQITFSIPQSSCSGFDLYKYGMESRNPYMAAVPDAQIISQFAQRQVTVLLGDLDTDPTGTGIDTACPAELQGSYRLQRGLNFKAYLLHYFGPSIQPTHLFAEVPGVAHDSRGMFTSACGLFALFGYGSCGALAGVDDGAPGPGGALQQARLSCEPNPIRGQATISLAVPKGQGPATVSVFDVRGRLVRTLTTDMSNGRGALVWDGRSSSGNELSSGVYFVRLEHADGTVETPVVLLR